MTDSNKLAVKNKTKCKKGTQMQILIRVAFYTELPEEAIFPNFGK